MVRWWYTAPPVAVVSIWRLAVTAFLLLMAAGPRGWLPGVHADSAATWTRLPTQAQPPARSQFGMTIDGAGTLYVYGGHAASGGPLADFWRLRHGDTRWQQLPNSVVPPLIEPHLTADAAGNVFEFGGIVQSAARHVTADGHSYGLYEYMATQSAWIDLTTIESHPSEDWPQGREDHGFAYDAGTGDLYVFAGEGSGEASLDDMWRYDERTHLWTQIHQRFDPPAPIDAREIYNISPDNHGGIWLFGGAFLFDAAGKRALWSYVNDLWRFDIATSTWHLIAGHANAYDPAMPVPRHYYGQAADGAGNFYVLGGYLADINDPPFFSDDDTSLYAQVIVFDPPDTPSGYVMYALADFWRFDAAHGRWVDLSGALGDLQGKPFIPYVMVADPTAPRLLTFGGYYTNSNGELQAAAALHSYPLPADDVARPPSWPPVAVPASGHRSGTAGGARSATPSASPTATTRFRPAPTASAPAWPTPAR